MKKVLTIWREQICHILVDVPDNIKMVEIHRINTADLLKGVAGLDWETQGNSVIADVRDATEEAVAECSGEATVR